MSYLHIENLDKDGRVLLFKQVWATEKIHGTGAWIVYSGPGPKLKFHSGQNAVAFASLFDAEKIKADLAKRFDLKPVTLYGEHYGGKIMADMVGTYGPEYRFALYDVLVDGKWLSFDIVQKLGAELGLDVVSGHVVDATIETLAIERDRPSEQAVKNGITEPRKREGIVIRPLREMYDNKSRIIAKFKGDDFRETRTPRVPSAERLPAITEAEKIAWEWVTEMRLTHVLNKLGNPTDPRKTPEVIAAMTEDILRESKGEIVFSPEAGKAIARAAGALYIERPKKVQK